MCVWLWKIFPIRQIRVTLAAFASVRGEEKAWHISEVLTDKFLNIPFPFTPIRLTTVGDADLAITRRSYVFKYLENDFPAYIVFPSEGLL